MTTLELTEALVNKLEELNTESNYKNSMLVNELKVMLIGMIKDAQGASDAHCLKTSVISPIFFFAKEMETHLEEEFGGVDAMRSDLSIKKKLVNYATTLNSPSRYGESPQEKFKTIRKVALDLAILSMVYYDTAFHDLLIRNQENIYTIESFVNSSRLPISTANSLFLRAGMEERGYGNVEISKKLPSIDHYRTEYIKMVSEMVDFDLNSALKKMIDRERESNEPEEELTGEDLNTLNT